MQTPKSSAPTLPSLTEGRLPYLDTDQSFQCAW
jgi:hypothetical protein